MCRFERSRFWAPILLVGRFACKPRQRQAHQERNKGSGNATHVVGPQKGSGSARSLTLGGGFGKRGPWVCRWPPGQRGAGARIINYWTLAVIFLTMSVKVRGDQV